MHDVAIDLLILLAGIWIVAVTLRPLGLPTIMGELVVGVLVGPAVFGWITPNDAIQLLAEIGIFFLMFHAGVETQPREFLHALRRSIGVAIVGAIVPFGVSFLVARSFGLGNIGATFVGLTMTATAVVITLKSLKDLGLSNTRLARVIVASCVIDDMLTLVVFGVIIAVLSGGEFEPMAIVITLAKVIGFFGVTGLMGQFIYPRLKLPFHSPGGKGFTFMLFMAIALGLFAEVIGLHMILGAYVAGLFFEDKVANPNLVRVVVDRTYGIAYSFLGPIFFISLGFSITFDISTEGVWFLLTLTSLVIIGQILSAGSMALQMKLPWREALTVGVGMCGRAELAFILASLALSKGAIDQPVFSVLIFTAFILNLFTPLALKGCAVLLEGRAARRPGATKGVLQIDKFAPLFTEERSEQLPHTLPDVADGVVIYGHGAEVESLIEELGSRGVPVVIIEENEDVARRLLEQGHRVVHTTLATKALDLGPLVRARAIVANGEDDDNAVFTLEAREQGFTGPIVALIRHRQRRAATMLAGATTAFTPAHVLAAALTARASSKIGPRVEGMHPLGEHIEVVEIRVRADSPLANKTLAESAIRSRTGANIVGQWTNDALQLTPEPQHVLEPDAILVAAGSPESIDRLRGLARPIGREGPIIVSGLGDIGAPVAEFLTDGGEEVRVIDAQELPGVDVVGDILEESTLERAGVADARAVILALGDDGAVQLAASVVRQYAPDVPIIAGIEVSDNVERIQSAGADFVLSLGQVAGQLLAHHVLGETISIQPRIRIVKTRSTALEGKNPLTARIRERTGCSVVAVERGEEVLMDFPREFSLAPGDALYICGTTDAVNQFYDEFPGS